MLNKITDSLARSKAPGKSSLLTNATKNRYLTAASGVLRWALQEEIIEAMPSVPWLNEKDERKSRDILQWGQEDVVMKLMRDAGAEVEALCVETLIETGLRSGELLRKVKPDQVTIERLQDEDGTDVLVGALWLNKGQTKNKTYRVVLFSADIAREIKAHLVAGTLPTGDRLLDAFKSACTSAGYTGNLVIHSLRHTRNTRLRKAGVDKNLRKEIIGHITDEANEIYDHIDLEDQLEAVRKVREYAGKRAARAKMATSQVIEFARAGAG